MRKIIKYPHIALTQPTKKVKEIDDELIILLDEMYEIIKKEDAIGIAANQLGVLKRVCVVELDEETSDIESTTKLTKWKNEPSISDLQSDLESAESIHKEHVAKTEKWLNENMEDIMTQAVQMVWFGLTDDGYFMAVIPENWSEIEFDTTNDGELILIN